MSVPESGVSPNEESVDSEESGSSALPELPPDGAASTAPSVSASSDIFVSSEGVSGMYPASLSAGTLSSTLSEVTTLLSSGVVPLAA